MNRLDALQKAMLAGRPLPLPIIDIHGHNGPYAPFHIPGSDAASMVRVMDSVGVAMLGTSAHCSWHSDARFGNDSAAAAAREFPGRFFGYAVVNPHYPDRVVPELERAFDELGFRAIKLHPGVHRYSLADKGYEKAYAFAAERRAPVLTHTWDGDAVCSADVAAVAAKRWPTVEFVWGHAGAPTFDKALEYAATLPNVYVDLACSRVYNGVVEHFLERAPVEKVLFASDMAFISLPQQVAKVVFAGISEADKRKLLHDNAAALLARAGIEAP